MTGNKHHQHTLWEPPRGIQTEILACTARGSRELSRNMDMEPGDVYHPGRAGGSLPWGSCEHPNIVRDFAGILPSNLRLLCASCGTLLEHMDIPCGKMLNWAETVCPHLQSSAHLY